MKKLIAIILTLMFVISACTFAVADADKETVKAVQENLNKAGFDCGTPDGVAGKKTYAAIEQYQQANGLTVTGDIDDELLIAMGLMEAPKPVPEIMFQNIPWGTNVEDARTMLVESGFADGSVRYGWGNIAYIIPDTEEGILNSGGFYDYNDYIQDYAYTTRVDALKSVGGYNTSAVELSCLQAIENGEVVPEDYRLLTVKVSFEFKEVEEAANACIDLLEKLEAAYGTFKKYQSKYWNEPEMKLVSSKFSDIKKVECMDRFRFYIFGENNTAILLTMPGGKYISLYYTKADAYKLVEEFKAIDAANATVLPDAGL